MGASTFCLFFSPFFPPLAAVDFYWLQRAQMKTACRHLNTIDVIRVEYWEPLQEALLSGRGGNHSVTQRAEDAHVRSRAFDAQMRAHGMQLELPPGALCGAGARVLTCTLT